MAEAAAGGAENTAEEEEEIPTMQKVAILMVSLGECFRRGHEAPDRLRN